MSATQIVFGGYQGDNSVHTRGAQRFCAALDEILGDRVKITFRQNIVEQGKKASELLSMTESGELDGCYFSSSYLAGRVPELALFDQHFAVADRHHAYAVLDGSLGRRLAAEVEANTGFKVAGYWDNGLRHISSVDASIRTPADCTGLKLRTLASDDHQRVFRALGFDPVAIDVRDLPDAVRTGRVDAQENPLTNIYNFELHKTHRTVTLTGHLLGVALVLFNRERFESWPGDVRDGVLQALEIGTAHQRFLAEEDDTICADALRQDGVELIELTAAEREAFSAAVRDEVSATRSRFDAELIRLFEDDLEQVGT